MHKVVVAQMSPLPVHYKQLFFRNHLIEKGGDQALLLENSLRLDFFCKKLKKRNHVV